MTLVAVLAAVASRVCPCAFPPMLSSSCPLTSRPTPHLYINTTSLTSSSSRHSTATICTGASAVLHEHTHDTRRDDWSAIALYPTCSLTRAATSISAASRRIVATHCCHTSWLGGEGIARFGVLQLLEESECIPCPSFTGSVCSWHSPARP